MANRQFDVFRDKNIWITGASSGIGEALAYELAKRGARLILSARNMEGLKRVRNACCNPESIVLLQVDLEQTELIQPKAEQVLQQYGFIDFLFNVAGIAARDAAMQTKLQVDQKIMNINYFGTIALTKAVLPGMIIKGSGHIVTVTSVAGKYGLPMLSAYAASKHALHGFFDSLRSELDKKNIRITLIVPGAVNTPITRNAITGNGENFGKMLQIQRDGLAPGRCAVRILNAVSRGRQEAVIGGVEESFTLFLKKFFPGYFTTFIRNHPLKKWRKIKKSLTFKR